MQQINEDETEQQVSAATCPRRAKNGYLIAGVEWMCGDTLTKTAR